MGPDSYEKSVNAFFWLYRDDSSSADICLGTVDYGQYRLADSYLCAVKKIGWNESFLIAQTKNEQFIIQDLRPLKGKPSSVFVNYKYGPFSKQQFNLVKDSLHVDRGLDFQTTY